MEPAIFWRHVSIGGPDDCWLWVAKSRTDNGYGMAWATMDGRKRSTTAHRVAFFYATGNAAPAGMDVMHSCDVRLCCNPAHLSLGTRTDNMRDCAAKGRTRGGPLGKGEFHNKAKLTEKQAIEALEASRSGENYVSIAKRYGVNAESIALIARGKTWKHLGGDAIARKRKVLTEEERKFAIAQRLDGERLDAIAANFNTNRHVISKLCKKACRAIDEARVK